jgi:hypothetical protein
MNKCSGLDNRAQRDGNYDDQRYQDRQSSSVMVFSLILLFQFFSP